MMTRSSAKRKAACALSSKALSALSVVCDHVATSAVEAVAVKKTRLVIQDMNIDTIIFVGIVMKRGSLHHKFGYAGMDVCWQGLIDDGLVTERTIKLDNIDTDKVLAFLFQEGFSVTDWTGQPNHSLITVDWTKNSVPYNDRMLNEIRLGTTIVYPNTPEAHASLIAKHFYSSAKRKAIRPTSQEQKKAPCFSLGLFPSKALSALSVVGNCTTTSAIDLLAAREAYVAIQDLDIDTMLFVGVVMKTAHVYNQSDYKGLDVNWGTLINDDELVTEHTVNLSKVEVAKAIAFLFQQGFTVTDWKETFDYDIQISVYWGYSPPPCDYVQEKIRLGLVVEHVATPEAHASLIARHLS